MTDLLQTQSSPAVSQQGHAVDGQEPIYSRFIDDDIYIPLLIEFAADLPGHISELAVTIGQGDGAKIARLSHRLKGAAATYGYPQLAQIAHEIEALTSNGADPSTDLSLTHRLKELHHQLDAVAQLVCQGTRLRTTPRSLQ